MNNITDIKKFIRFLKANNIYCEYITCATNPSYTFDKHYGDTKQQYDCLKDFLLNARKSYFIGNAFSWKKTPQGHEFWLQMSHLWMKYLKNGETINNQ